MESEPTPTLESINVNNITLGGVEQKNNVIDYVRGFLEVADQPTHISKYPFMYLFPTNTPHLYYAESYSHNNVLTGIGLVKTNLIDLNLSKTESKYYNTTREISDKTLYPGGKP